MKRLLSIFDMSGQWPYYYSKSGKWDVIHWDIKLSEFMDINFIETAEIALDMFEDVDGILAAIPCTEFASSGAQYWPIKDEDGRTYSAMQIVRQVERLVDLFEPTDPDYDGTFFWAAENPVGRLGKLTGWDAPMYFNPCDYAGHLQPTPEDIAKLDVIRSKDGNDVTEDEAYFILDMNAYTKKTGLWGNFNRNLVHKPIQAAKGCPQGSPMQRFGGKSDKTKEIRSMTPLGFAKAFYEANH